jgi:predicted nucleic acid-binding protein
MRDGHETAETQPDVGAILEALRADVRAQRLARGRAEPSPAERDLQRALDEIELYRVISAHWPLLGTTLPQRVIALLNKLVRRYLRWYINPIVEQQNAYNDAVARTLRLLAEAYAELGEQTDDRRPTTDDRPPESVASRPLSVVGSGESTTDHGPRTTDHGQLMSLVRARGAAEPPVRLPDLDLYAVAPQLHLREQVNAHWPLLGTTLPQRVIALLNKLVRRYLRWYINPIVEQQNAANAAFTIALMRLIALDAERRAEVAALRAKGKR